MQVNKISNINFRDNKSENAILALKDKNASIKFQQSLEYARKADTMETNPFVALGYKLYRTFNMIKNNEESQEEQATKQFRAVA